MTWNPIQFLFTQSLTVIIIIAHTYVLEDWSFTISFQDSTLKEACQVLSFRFSLVSFNLVTYNKARGSGNRVLALY